MKPSEQEQHPEKHECILTLENGAEVLLRPLTEKDRPLILDLFERMSPESIYLRFLSHIDTMPENLIRQLLHIDYHNNLAIAALVKEEGRDVIIAVGRYGYEQNEGARDLAVAVRDDWQQCGLGIILLKKVVDIAGDYGITRFSGIMDMHNDMIQKVLSQLGYHVKYSPVNGFYRVDIEA